MTDITDIQENNTSMNVYYINIIKMSLHNMYHYPVSSIMKSCFPFAVLELNAT